MLQRSSAIVPEQFTTFGELLKYLRRRAGLTQRELSIAVGYSDTQISRMEQNQRIPDQTTLTAQFVPALDLAYEPNWVARLLELAAEARGEVLPASHLGSSPLPLHNLPFQLTSFIGREVELAQLAGLLADPAYRLVTILGAGGMGKTRLALELAATQLDRFEHGVYFVRLGPLDSPESIIPAIAEALHFPFYGDSRPEQQLHNYLRQKQVLLVMDNYEHLLDPPLPQQTVRSLPVGHAKRLQEGRKGGAEVAVDLLQAASGLKILATSRARLNIQEEQSFLISGIDFPDKSLAEAVDQFSAVKLFLASAGRVRSDFALTAGDKAAVARICRLVEGMPLGLILAASWVEMLSLAEIADELARSLDFLAGNWRDLPHRQQSLRAVFDHSWRLLTEQEQAVFRQMSVFRGGFTREAVEVITGASLPTLRTLVNKSLLQRTPTGRYEIHELLRQYAAEQLAEQTSAEQSLKGSEPFAASLVRDRYSAYYCAFLQEREVDLKGARQQAALLEIESDGENARAAWQWAVERKQIEQIGQALESLSLFYLWRSRLYEGEAVCRQAAEELATALPGEKAGGQRTVWPPAHARVLVKVLIWRSIFNRHLRQLEGAQQVLQQAQALLDNPIFVEQDTQSEQAHLLLEQAEIASNSRFGEAKDLVEQSLALYRILKDHWRLAQGLELLGELVRDLGQLDQARQVHQESLTLRQALGDSRSIARSLQKVAGVARNQGQFEEAEQLNRKSISIFREIGDRNQLARGINDLGVTLAHGGKFADSLPLFKESLEIYHNLGLPDEPGVPTLVSGFALVHLGQYQEAQVYLQKAMMLYRQIGNKSGVGFALQNFGRIALAEERCLEAQHPLQESLTIFRSLEAMSGLGESLGILGCMALRLNNRRQAQHYIHENLQIAVATRIFLPLMTALTGIALLMAEQGDKERAVELCTLALQHPHVANSRWFEDVAGRHLAAATATLPPKVVAAAQERGRGRDVWATVEEFLEKLKE